MTKLTNKSSSLSNTRSVIYAVLFCVAMFFSKFIAAQGIDVSIATSGGTEPGDTVTITFTVTCIDPLPIRPCRMGNFAPGSGNITISGAVNQVFNIDRLGQLTSGQSRTRIRTFTVAGNQGDIITINAFYEGYCRSNDSNGPTPPDTAEVNCSDTADPINLVVTPVTLSSFSSIRTGNKLEIDWGTSSELFNVGFQLWGFDGVDDRWEKLHNWLVKSGSGNSVEPQSYAQRVQIPSFIKELVSVGISSVDSDGTEHYYGPFNVGQSYGELSALEPIAWDAVRSELDARLLANGYVRDRALGYRRAPVDDELSALSASEESVIEFRVNESGIYRITASELLNAGVDWSSVSSDAIAIVDSAGQGVVRYALARGAGSGQSRALGTDGELYFYGSSVDETSGLYTDRSVYRLVLDPYRALRAPLQGKQGISGGLSDQYKEYSEVELDKTYILTSALDDPWVDGVVVGYSDQPGSYGTFVPVEGDGVWADGAQLHLRLGRSSALGAVDADGDGVQDAEHEAEGALLVAGQLVSLGTQTSMGAGAWSVSYPIPGDAGLSGLNEVFAGGIFRSGAGYAFSEVHVDAVGLEYSRPLVAKDGDDYLTFTGLNDGELGYEVQVPNSGWPWVFAYNTSGSLVRIGLESQSLASGVRTVRFASLLGSQSVSTNDPVQYWVSGKPGYLSVEDLSEKSIRTQADLLAQAQGSNYLMIAHPTFMGASLDSYAAHKQSQGYTAAIINYLDVVDAYGGGQAGPEGLTNYLNALEAQGNGIDHVLLVGGSTYDHLDQQGTGAVTFIPGHYGESNYSKFTVSDAPYVMDAEGNGFANIGRWPVRSMADLQVIVDKSLLWASTDHSGGEALLIAEHTVAGENINFKSALNGVAQTLPGDYGQTAVYVDQIMDNDPTLSLTQALAQAKAEIIAGLNNTPDVVLYNGHASTRQLSNQNLFKSGDIAQVTASGAEVWLPMSCYVTYYESTHVNTLAHQLMFSGNAVNITGAMLLSNQGENIQMGTSILDGTMNQGQSLGEAVNQAKATQNNPKLDINWSLLGDPTLSF